MEQSDFVHTGQKVGLVMASVVTPSTLAPSLSKRSWQDQGLITGLSTGASYLLALFVQDVIDVVARAGAATTWALFPDDWSEERRRSVAALGCELAMAPLGLGLAAYLDRRGVATARDGLVRQGAWRMGSTAFCGTVLIGATAAVRRLDRASGPRDASRPCPCRSPWAWPRPPSSSALAGSAPTAVSMRPVTSRPSVGSPPEAASSRCSTAPAGSSGGRPSRCADSPPGQPPVPASRGRSSRTRRSRREPASSSARCGPGPCSGSRP